jgi:ATP-dependent DNA helicase RecG
VQRNSDFFSTPIEYLKGVGPQRGQLLRTELNISSFGDLLRNFPFRYIDRSRFYKIAELNDDLPYIQLRGVLSVPVVSGQKRATRLNAWLTDDTGKIELVWFQGVKWLKESLKPNTEYIIFGRPSLFNGKFNIVHPEMETAAEWKMQSGPTLQGVYSTTEKCRVRGLDSKGIYRLQKSLHDQLPSIFPETLPDFIRSEAHLQLLSEAYRQVHFPANEHALVAARHRLKFDELFYLQLRLLRAKAGRQSSVKGKPVLKIGEYFNTFYHHHLPFGLTNAQKRVLKEIRNDMGSGKQMNRLLQGDVGSGKTVVALLSMLMVMDNGFQACLMAPTEILARQHFQSIAELLGDTDIRIGVLTGSTKTAERKFLLEELKEGRLHIIIGTHALIEDRVQFASLGLVVIDEQHRFGVEQRAKLWKKDDFVPHVLVMTATPIPRTLAMTSYGDLDTSIIDELPPGRKPIETVHRTEEKRLAVFGFIRKEIAKGRQVYIVYPLIDESEKMDYMNLMQGYEAISREFPLPEYRVSVLHGKMKPAEKDVEMKRFKEGQTHIMVSTTVIEVGVNVPNASVMIIESAERFGLSQLHQLRGRVGRGAEQSYCILMTGNKLSKDSRVRIKTMCETNDGFIIAETDLKLRGPGDIAGTMQSGVVDFKIADLAKDGKILDQARQIAMEVIDKDPSLVLPENQILSQRIAALEKEETNYSRIS